jgi:hypothetical protein
MGEDALYRVPFSSFYTSCENRYNRTVSGRPEMHDWSNTVLNKYIGCDRSVTSVRSRGCC